MKLSSLIPILRSFDESKAREFYCDFLGFEIDWEHRFEPGTPLYMQVSRDGVALHISEHHGDASPGSTVRIHVDDIDVLHRELSEKQYKYARPGVQEQPWGMREMTVNDPFGNKVIFAQELET
ncbi:MAG: VOC family protein [Alphaproteobacteria bacterium]|nr:VOC family protein [Alphaproteobacteria bacterium]